MGILEFSYDRLHEKLKLCAIYCSLFPKGRIYYVDVMVRIWIALGYVKADYKSLEDVGQDYVQMLANRGFFQYVEEDEFGNIKSFKLHDVIHGLMLFKSKSRYKMVDSKTTEIDENICHVSFLYNSYEINWDGPSSIYNTKQRLKSILMVENDPYRMNFGHHTFRFRSGCDKSGCDKVFVNFKGLKVLDVHAMRIKKIPRSVGKLILLTYLDLSRNDMEELPSSITELINLLSLDLSLCNFLRKLPTDIRKLYKLRHLRLYGCHSLTCMPKGLGKLRDLQTLDWFIVGEDKGNVMVGLEELTDLKNLKGRLIINMVVESSKYVASKGQGTTLTPPLGRKDNLTELDLKFNKSAKEDELVLEGLRPRGEKLTRMKIFGYGGKKLPNWMMDDHLCCDLPNLIDIWMTNYNANIDNWKIEPALECRPWLRIDLWDGDQLLESVPGFSELKGQLKMSFSEVGFIMPKGDISKGLILWDLTIFDQLATSQQHHPSIFFKSWFPNLKRLRIARISTLEVLPEQFRELSCLEELELGNCPNLKALPDWIGTLTSLKRIGLYLCSKIETLPRQISSLSQLVDLKIAPCSKAFVERCRKPTGELWPFIQHVDSIHITTIYCAGDYEKVSFTHSKNDQ